MRKPLRYAYRVLGRRYPRVLLALQFQITHFVVFGGVGLLLLYQHVSEPRFWRIVIVSQALILFENAFGLWQAFQLLKPADPWLRGQRDEAGARAAWVALAGLPLDFIRTRRALVVIGGVVPISLYVYFELALPPYALPILLAGGTVILLYAALGRYFGIELILRPVLEQVSGDLDDVVVPPGTAVALRTKLMVVLPVINVVTGVLVAAISTRGRAHLVDLGIDVAVAVAVALTIAGELTVLLSRSILEPISDLREATERVAAGDFETRVPVITADETGALAASFNRMVAGLAEREQLREAFDTYVDPEVTERVLAEGATLAGEEVEVSVLFLDIRDFTAFAERASASEVVAQLNEFYELVVPLLGQYGGHADKFIGDGLLGVFGAPQQLADHADLAVSAALEIARVVRMTYGDRLRIGIGVNSGTVVAGTIGGGGRLEFTVIGDTVNTASRVEALTRKTGDDVLITEATLRLLTRGHGGFEPRPTVELKGKTEVVPVHAPVAAVRPAAIG